MSKRILNNWTDVQRTVLYFLYEHPNFKSFDAATRTRIFNLLFEEEIKASGFRHGLGEVALYSQYRDRTRAERAHLWTNILRDRRTEAEEQEREELIKRVSDAAVTLGVVAKKGRLSAAEEANAAELLNRDDEAYDSGLATPTQKDRMSTTTSSEGAMGMLHSKDLTWNVNSPSIDSIHNALIASSSPIYQHGGQVHRVAINSNNTEADFMICDTMICTSCFESANPTMTSQTQGLPFIHSSDTFMDAEHTYFRPKPRVHLSERPKNFLRKVQFKGTNGDLTCWVRICGNIGCRVCMYGNIQRNPHLANRYVPRGDAGGGDMSEGSGDGGGLSEMEDLNEKDE